jgi:DNA-directed RNA polymerase subunit RPC12/RpoP
MVNHVQGHEEIEPRTKLISLRWPSSRSGCSVTHDASLSTRSGDNDVRSVKSGRDGATLPLGGRERSKVAVEVAIKFKFAPKADPAMEVVCLGCGRPWEVQRSQLQDTTNLVCPSCGAIHPLRRQEVLNAMQELLDAFWGRRFPAEVSAPNSGEAHRNRT